jgi:NTE family protein
MTSVEAPRIGLVLGAGGVLGGAWLVGALRALATECKWDPTNADHFVGTSAGALVAALLASAISPSSDLLHAATFHALSPPRPLPGSLALVRAGLTGSTTRPLLATAGGLLPRGVISTTPIKEVVRRRAGERWPTRRKLWIVACDYQTGRRTVFGRADGEHVGLPSAVAASCAIPGFYQPERIGLREYNLEPRPPGRAAARPGDLPQPDVRRMADASLAGWDDGRPRAERRAPARAPRGVAPRANGDAGRPDRADGR